VTIATIAGRYAPIPTLHRSPGCDVGTAASPDRFATFACGGLRVVLRPPAGITTDVPRFLALDLNQYATTFEYALPSLIEAAIRPRRVLLSPASVAAMAAIFLLMGMVVGGYGPLLDQLTRRFGVSLPVAGSVISVHFAGSLPGVLIAMQTFARFR
jgi:hypothetical protein